MSNSKAFKKLIRAMQRITGRSYQDCLQHIRKNGAGEKIHAELARWKGLSEDERLKEKA